jgi:hypothetical protein
MIWKKVNGYPYSINELGQVRNNKTGRILKKCISTNGYVIVNLTSDAGKQKVHNVHRLVGVYFLSCPPDMQVDHIDGDRANNNLSNLRVVTHQQNAFNNHVAKGYTWVNRVGKWKAQIMHNGKQNHIGHYATEEEARAAYLAAKAIMHPLP